MIVHRKVKSWLDKFKPGVKFHYEITYPDGTISSLTKEIYVVSGKPEFINSSLEYRIDCLDLRTSEGPISINI